MPTLIEIEQLREHHAFAVASIAGIIGLCIGSFLNVCAHRIPTGKSIVSPPSSCACGQRIPFWLNIPVIGWLTLRGKARCCGQAISLRYPLLEVAGGLALAAAWFWLPVDRAIAASFLLPILLLLTACDIDSMLVPDGPNFLLVAIGLTLAVALPSIHGEGGHSLAILDRIASLETALVGVAVGTAATWWVRTLGTVFFGKEAMGEADIILCAGMGAFGGWQGALFTLFGGAIVGLVLVLPSLIRARIKNSPGPASVPFVPSLAIAGAIWFFRGNELVEMWMNLGR